MGMPHLSRMLKSFALVTAVTLAATSLRAAPEDGMKPAPQKTPKQPAEIMIPIPHEPDAADNGCRVRSSPAEAETGAVTEIPFWSLVEHDMLKYGIKLMMDGPVALNTEIGALDEETRTFAVLYAFWYNLRSRDALHGFFYSQEAGRAAPQIRDTLQQAGLSREQRIFERAMALFGRDYPVDYEVRKQHFGWSKPSKRIDAVTTIPAPLNKFDHELMALGDEFGKSSTFRKTLTAWVEARPVLWQRFEAQRKQLNEPDRIRILGEALGRRMGNLWDPYQAVDQRLATLTTPQRTFAVMDAFNDQFRNGGVDQFFYNSEGSLAPYVHAAMKEMGMARQAEIFARGLATFSVFYPRDTQARRERYFHKDAWSDDRNKLSALTDELYALDGGLSFHQIKGSMVVEGGPGIDFAMRNYARKHKLLPC